MAQLRGLKRPTGGTISLCATTKRSLAATTLRSWQPRPIRLNTKWRERWKRQETEDFLLRPAYYLGLALAGSLTE